MEQIDRFGCMGFMIFNIPGTWFGWWSDEAFAVCFVGDILLLLLYCGIMSRSVLLIIAALVFAPSHIMISYRNVKWR